MRTLSLAALLIVIGLPVKGALAKDFVILQCSTSSSSQFLIFRQSESDNFFIGYCNGGHTPCITGQDCGTGQCLHGGGADCAVGLKLLFDKQYKIGSSTSENSADCGSSGNC